MSYTKNKRVNSFNGCGNKNDWQTLKHGNQLQTKSAVSFTANIVKKQVKLYLIGWDSNVFVGAQFHLGHPVYLSPEVTSFFL